MHEKWPEELRARLAARRDELNEKLERITANVRRSLDGDSEERAKQLADSEVVDALGNDAREELHRISATLARMDSGEYGLCAKCGEPIAVERIRAYPYASECIDCAELDEQRRGRR